MDKSKANSASLTEDLELDLNTMTCHISRSNVTECKEIKWNDLLVQCCERDLIYYVDLEAFNRQISLVSILGALKSSDTYTFNFRANAADGNFVWMTVNASPAEITDGKITKLHITAADQNTYHLNGNGMDCALIKEMLFKGFGSVYSGMIFINVNENKYMVQNLYSDDCREELMEKPVGNYSDDTITYAANYIYPDDRGTFTKFCSPDWFRSNLNREGLKFSFRVRHICNGEFHWVEVNIVCTKHTETEHHVLFWMDDVQNESFADAETQNTLMSAEIGQWRLELRHDHTSKMLLSSSLERILGIGDNDSTDELVDKLSDRICDEDRNMVWHSVLSVPQGEKTTIVFRWEHPTLGMRYYRCGCTCIAKSERYTCFCGYGQDITEDMRQIIENEKKMKAAMLEAKKANAAKTAFLSRMSHDIRTPLNGIIGLLDIDERNADNIELLKEHRAKARIAANHLMSLINDVLELNKLDDKNITLAHEAFNLSQMAREILTIGEMRAVESGVRLIHEDCNLNITVPYVYGSPLHVRQIFLNIIGNAIKYNKPGGLVTCRVETFAQTDKTVTYRCTISDTGIGMSEDFLKHIFEPFAQERQDSRSFYQGTGLGMSIVKSLVDKMNGTIDIKSEKGVGSTFTVTIPFEIADSADIADALEYNDDADISGVKILLAEDNELNREIAHTLLEERGAVITDAADGKYAVELFENNPPDTFDMILMDVMMPNIDGLKATRMIREFPRSDAAGIPIIAMTANAFSEDIMRTKQAGMNAHLSKPLDIKKVISVIAKFRGAKK